MMSYTVLFSLLLICLVGVYGQQSQDITANLPITAGNNVAQYDTPINVNGLTPLSTLTVEAQVPAPQIYVCLRQYVQPSNNVANWATECGESFFSLDSTTTTASATAATSAASTATTATTAASTAASTATTAASTATTASSTAATATTAATSDATTATAATTDAATVTTDATAAASTASTAASTATTAASTASAAATTATAASTAATSDATTATSATNAATTASSTAATAVTTATNAASTATTASSAASTAATTATVAASTATTLTTATTAASTATTAASTATTAASTATTAATTATAAATTATSVATTATIATTDAATTAATAVAAGPTAAATNAASTATSASATTVVRSFPLGGMFKRLQTFALRQSTNDSNSVLLATGGDYYLAVGIASSAAGYNGTISISVTVPPTCSQNPQMAGPNCEGEVSGLVNGTNIYSAQPNTTQYLSFNVPAGTLSMSITVNNTFNSTGLWAAAPTVGNVPTTPGTTLGNADNTTTFSVALPAAGTYYMSLSNTGNSSSSPSITYTLNTCPDTAGTSMVGPDCNTTINQLSSTNVVTAQLNGTKGWYYFQPTAAPLRVSVIGNGIAGKNYTNNFIIYGKQGQVPTADSWDIVAYANPSNNQYFPTILSAGNNATGTWYFGVTNQNSTDTQFGIWQTSVCPNNCGGGNTTAPCGTGNEEGICQCGAAPSGMSFAYDCRATKGGSGKKGGISTEVIILIVIGVVTVSAIVAGTAFYLYRRSQRQGYTRV